MGQMSWPFNLILEIPFRFSSFGPRFLFGTTSSRSSNFFSSFKKSFTFIFKKFGNLLFDLFGVKTLDAFYTRNEQKKSRRNDVVYALALESDFLAVGFLTMLKGISKLAFLVENVDVRTSEGDNRDFVHRQIVSNEKQPVKGCCS